MMPLSHRICATSLLQNVLVGHTGTPTRHDTMSRALHCTRSACRRAATRRAAWHCVGVHGIATAV